MTALTHHQPAPAPLDPSKVKAGDTVKLTSPASVNKGTVKVPARIEGVVREVLPDGRIAVHGVQGFFFPSTLTDHQPAPDPEPEWKRGTVARLSLVDDDLAPRVYRTGIGTWRAIDDSRSWTDADVEYVHEMVVIDPADVDEQHRLAAIIREVDGNHDLGAGALAEAILEHLGLNQ